MFLDSARLNQLNKNIFGHGILQTKKLIPDSGRMVMPDPSLPKIKRYNIKSNTPLNYLLNTALQSQAPQPVSNAQEIQLPPQPQENPEQQEQELYSQKSIHTPKEPEQSGEPVVETKPEPEPEPEPVAEPQPATKKYVITNLGENNVLLPPNYSTDDELEFKVINLLNEPKENFTFACENKFVKVYKRKVSFLYIYNFKLIYVIQGENDVQILKTVGTIPYPIATLKPILSDTPGMDNWDKTFKKHEVVEQFPEENGMKRQINYMYIKMPVFMTDRDLVQEKKTWENYNDNPANYMSIYTSTTHSKYPAKEKPIRADMIIGGLYLKELGPNETGIYLINNFDLKITTGKDIVDSAAPDRAKEFVPNLVKYIKKKE